MARTGRPRSVVLPMEEIRQLSAQGLCLRELASRFGCSRDCIMKRMKEAGIPRLPPWSQPGSRNGQWRGGSFRDDDGYILIYAPSHPFATNAGYVREHRLVMESILRRYLRPSEIVHHIDGNKANNSPNNLQLFAANADHLRNELKGKIPRWTEAGLDRIRQGIRRSVENRRASTRSKKGSDGRV